MAVKTKKLYALCVGINDYQYVGKLGGCVPDANNILNYLKSSTEETEYELDAVLLTDAQATKSNICDAFLNHLTKAGPEDTAVFYFSGHGAEETADEIWKKSEGRGLLTTIVCYDSRNGTVPDLADKEIRYMVAKVAEKKPHFVLIMDSCHSGGSSRSDMTPRLTGHSEGRDWDKFIFAKEFPYDDVKDKNIKEWLPEGEHIHFASCNDKELAYEVRGSGIFTSNLLDILKRSSGKVNYYNVLDRIRNYVKGRYPQTPQFYAHGQAKKDAEEKYFLGGASSGKGQKANVLYNRKLRGWVLDLGAIHGVTTTAANPDIAVDIFDHDNNLIGTAKVKEVRAGLSMLDIGDLSLDFKESYGASVKGIFKTPVKVYLKGDEESKQAIEEFKSSKMAFTNEDDGSADLHPQEEILLAEGVEFTDDETLADFCILGKNNFFSITNPFSKRALVQQFPEKGENAYKGKTGNAFKNERNVAMAKTFNSLKHMAKYTFTKNLSNPKTKLRPRPPVVLEIFNNGEETKPVSIVDGVADVTGISKISIKLTNKSSRDLYVSLLYMSNLYEVNNDLLSRVLLIEPDKSEYAWEGDLIPIDLSEWIEELNYPEEYFNLKVIVSTSDFKEKEFFQETLKPPSDPTNHRGLRKRAQNPDSEDWMSYVIKVRYDNPFYEKPEKA